MEPVYLRKIINNVEDHYAGWYTGKDVSFYVSSIVLPYDKQDETMVFLANNSGQVINWDELTTLYKRDHNEALKTIGFYIVEDAV